MKDETIIQQAEVIKKECGNQNLLLAGSDISPLGAFEFLESMFGDKYYWEITTSLSNKKSYYEFNKEKKPLADRVKDYFSYSMKLADFANQKQLIGSHVGLKRFINVDHRFVRKISETIGKINNEDLLLVKGIFSELGDCLNETRGISNEDLEALINNQKFVLEMLAANGLISEQEKIELVIRKEELPEWRL